MKKYSDTLIVILVLLTISGCGTGIKRNPVPESLVEVAQVPNLTDVRYWGDEPPPQLDAWFSEDRWTRMGEMPQNYLAISGGGEHGAYGAGFLKGWTESGNRPVFTIVTGISTGAIMAPFAFLGSDYDEQLEKFYTDYTEKQIVKKRSIFSILKHASVYDVAPLRAHIEKHVDAAMLAAIAAEYKKGRLLNIGTTNLDNERPMIWSIGRIAASGAPNALEMVHDIILASASIGAAFPPVIINVEANGQQYDEMHVDGGTVNQVFIFPPNEPWEKIRARIGYTDTPTVYILRNELLRPQYRPVKYSLIKILEMSAGSVLRAQGLGDLDQIFIQTELAEMNYRLTFIPDDFRAVSDGMYDLDYMNKLFDVGYRQGKISDPWAKVPPGFEE